MDEVTLSKKILLVSYSNIEKDPRVLRQIDWLSSDGWEIDSLGLGEKPRLVSNHFKIGPEKYSRVIRAIIPFVTTKKTRFRLLTQSRFPKELFEQNSYTAILANEIDLLPWVSDFVEDNSHQLKYRHLDLHEYHEYEFKPGTPRIFSKIQSVYHAWTVSLIGQIQFSSITTVASGIADLYRGQFKLKNIGLVYNSRKFEALEPSQVNPEKIELIYHGNAQLERGLEVLLKASTEFDSRFSLNMMLTGFEHEITQVKEIAANVGAKVTWHDRVAMEKVPERINRFDLEIIFYPPKSNNLLYSFPNKFFESIQARLGIIVGESPSMSTEVRRFNNGFIVEGWTPQDLAKLVNSLSPKEIFISKRNSNFAAKELVTEKDKLNFLSYFSM